MCAEVHELTDKNFEAEVINAQAPVVVDIWAPWCGPCRMVSPIIEGLAEENAGEVKVCKLNVDENPETAAKLGINAIPTILLFKEGEEFNRLIGVQPQSAYQDAINELVGQ